MEEIKGKRFGIANTTAKNELKQEPQLQSNEAVKNFVWTANPLDLDLTIQARKIISEKMRWDNATLNYGEKKNKFEEK